jgi:hypothetical protein
MGLLMEGEAVRPREARASQSHGDRRGRGIRGARRSVLDDFSSRCLEA